MTSKSLSLDLRDIQRILWYRKGTFLALVLLVTIASAVTAYRRPNVYEATSTILLGQKSIAESSVGSTTVTPDMRQRIRILKTVLMSEYLLRKVIAHLKLVPNIYDPLAVHAKIGELRQGIKVRVRGSDSLQISYQGTDRQRVMRIANELGNFFTEDTLRYLEKVMKGTSAFLEEELAETERKLRAQEQKMLAFKRKNAQELPGQMAANRGVLNRLRESLDDIDRRIRDLEAKRDFAQKELVEFESYPQDPAYRALERQVKQYQHEMQTLKTERADLRERVKGYEHHAPKVEQEWLFLTRGYDVLEERYRALMNRKLAAQLSLKVQELQRGENFRVLDPATIPHNPIRPNRYLIVAIGFIAGLGLGFGGVLLAEMTDSTVRSPSDLTIPLRLPLLACIPRFWRVRGQGAVAALTWASRVTNGYLPMRWPSLAPVPSQERYRALMNKKLDAQLSLNLAVPGEVPVDDGRHLDPALIMLSDPGSVPAEQYRHLRTSIKQTIHDDGGKVLVVTSAFPAEGKSVTAANLAVAMAFESDQNVLLIDAELRNPRVHKLFDLRVGPGLADVLSQTCPAEQALQQGPVDRLMVLSAGEARGNPADLITPRGMTRLLSELRGRFTYIILDSPPILPVADACVLSSCTDGVIMVARAGVSQRDVFTDALRRLGNGKAVGIVFNAVNPQLLGYRYYQYSGYERYGKKTTEK